MRPLFSVRGEEFVVVLPDTDPAIALAVAERIRETFEKEPFVVVANDGIQKTVYLTLCIGLATYRQGMSAGELIKQADLAIYRAKSEGKTEWSGMGLIELEAMWADPSAFPFQEQTPHLHAQVSFLDLTKYLVYSLAIMIKVNIHEAKTHLSHYLRNGSKVK